MTLIIYLLHYNDISPRLQGKHEYKIIRHNAAENTNIYSILLLRQHGNNFFPLWHHLQCPFPGGND